MLPSGCRAAFKLRDKGQVWLAGRRSAGKLLLSGAIPRRPRSRFSRCSSCRVWAGSLRRGQCASGKPIEAECCSCSWFRSYSAVSPY